MTIKETLHASIPRGPLRTRPMSQPADVPPDGKDLRNVSAVDTYSFYKVGETRPRGDLYLSLLEANLLKAFLRQNGLPFTLNERLDEHDSNGGA